MAVDQLPGQLREFASYLNRLLTRLDPVGGWYGVFWQRDPEGMRACLDGLEVPPWDVAEALLQDLATAYGPAAAAQEAERARALHAAALAAHDSRPGARDALGDRLGAMIREQRHAAERTAELTHRLRGAATPEEAESLRLDLAWAHDDHHRATARCAELRARLTDLDRRAPRTPAQDAPRFRDADAGAVFRVRHRGGYAPDLGEEGHGVTHTARDPYGRTGGQPDHREHPAEAEAGVGRTEETGPRSGAGAHGGSRPRPGVDPRAGTGARSGDGPRAASGRHTPGAGDTDDPLGFDQPGRTAAAATGSAPDGFAPAGPTRHAPVHDGAAPDSTLPRGAAPASRPHSEPPATPVPKQRTKSRRRPRGGARFAGTTDAEETPPAAVVPTMASSPAAPRSRAPRGARFAGVAETAPAAQPQPKRRQSLDDQERGEVTGTVERLLGLRREGRSGEAHALLVEVAHWPAARYPLLAAELHRAGLGADWATLLWEAASLPADRLVAAADALAAAGRTTDGDQMLRQGVARPAGEIGGAVLALARDGRDREVRALLDAYVRTRTPEEAARSAEADPQRVGPLLLEAARGVSDERYWDLVHALRVAGLAA